MEKPTLINLPKILDPRGNLTFVEGQNHIPFDIKRVYWVYDVPGGETRGGHAFKEQDEFIICLSGSFDVIIDTGEEIVKHSLNRSYYGVYIPAGVWRHVENFSTNSLALMLASTNFNENDYIRDYNEFKKFKPELKIKKPLENRIAKSTLPKTYNSIYDCSIIYFPKVHYSSGNITPIQGNKDIPFNINRVFYLYDIPGGEERGAHAHKECHQLLIAASGAFDILLDDGKSKRMITLNRPYMGLHIPPGIWAAEMGFSSGSICLVLASHKYDADDYIRNYDDFLTIK